MFESSDHVTGNHAPHGNTDRFTIEALIEALGCDDSLAHRDGMRLWEPEAFRRRRH